MSLCRKAYLLLRELREERTRFCAEVRCSHRNASAYPILRRTHFCAFAANENRPSFRTHFCALRTCQIPLNRTRFCVVLPAGERSCFRHSLLYIYISRKASAHFPHVYIVARQNLQRTHFCVDIRRTCRTREPAVVVAIGGRTYFCALGPEGEPRKRVPNSAKSQDPFLLCGNFRTAAVGVPISAGRTTPSEEEESPFTQCRPQRATGEKIFMRTRFCGLGKASVIASIALRTCFCERKTGGAYPFLRCAPQCAG